MKNNAKDEEVKFDGLNVGVKKRLPELCKDVFISGQCTALTPIESGIVSLGKSKFRNRNVYLTAITLRLTTIYRYI